MIIDIDSIFLIRLLKAKEIIKRKYQALKSGEADVHKLMSQTFKLIIEPLYHPICLLRYMV